MAAQTHVLAHTLSSATSLRARNHPKVKAELLGHSEISYFPRRHTVGGGASRVRVAARPLPHVAPAFAAHQQPRD